MAKKPQPKEPKKGAPAYMVSFGDMMTLILCFFILLVSLSQERSFGLMAKGVGSFIIAVTSHGLNGIMDAQEKQEVFDHVRRRFNLPPEEDPERRELDHGDASTHELVTAEMLEALEPHLEVRQPSVARFETDSAELSAGARTYLDTLAATLRPRRGQLLRLEGMGADSASGPGLGSQTLGIRRAEAVRQYLIRGHNYPPSQVEARAWVQDILGSGPPGRVVHARLITPPGSTR